jgi:hypothetical protein
MPGARPCLPWSHHEEISQILPEVMERAVRMVAETGSQYESQGTTAQPALGQRL